MCTDMWHLRKENHPYLLSFLSWASTVSSMCMRTGKENCGEHFFTLYIADWQLHMFGHTKHAFMNPQANDPALGLAYQPVTEARAFRLMKDFLTEIFQ